MNRQDDDHLKLLDEWNDLRCRTLKLQKENFVKILNSKDDGFELIRSEENKVVFRCNHRFENVLVRPRYVAQWDFVKKRAYVYCDKDSMRIRKERQRRFVELFTRKWVDIKDKVLCFHLISLRDAKNPEADGIDDVVFIDLICTACSKLLACESMCISADYRDVYDEKWGRKNNIYSGPM